VAANVVYFVVIILLIALPSTILPLLFDEFQNIVQDLYKALDEFQALLSNPISIGSSNIYLSSMIPAIRNALNTGYVPKPQDALNILEAASRNFLWLLVILVTAYYLMTDWERIRKSLISLAPKELQAELNYLYEDIRLIWNSYLLGQVRLIFILIIVYSVTWSAIGLPGAIALGVLAGVLNLLPEVGPGIIAIIAVVVAFLEGSAFLPISNLWFALLTLGSYLLLNNIKTIWLQPRILGHSVLLHEGLVFVAIVTAVILQGMLGVLIVVPLLATLAVIGRYLRAKILDLPPFEDEEPAFMQKLGPGAISNTESKPQKSPERSM
jgi:predicted PurR-regulated permease PerM